ncbi:MAG TPA: hypothetical protein P5217_07055 [Methanoregulaceae archaeon]|nr:hypothetical protein [Methanoregulaceae archaeon]HPD75661.1 hypothetical protein [Methanoregulaceae archaeon]HRY76024.1 hypothetical protein [Methanoregulaceae archaeon]
MTDRPTGEIPDFTALTCTSLMIRLKQKLKGMPEGGSFSCFVRRDQRDTVEVPFSRTGYDVTVSPEGKNRYIVTIARAKKEGVAG